MGLQAQEAQGVTEYPLQPDPDILIWFAEPRSQREVSRLKGVNRHTIYVHMRQTRRMGLINHVGSKPSSWGPRQQLYELTPAGVEYLEANDDGE